MSGDRNPTTDRYDDSVKWAEEQIEALRTKRFDDLDVDGIEEELRRLAQQELDSFEWSLIQLMMMELRVLAWPGVSSEDIRRFDLNEIREHARDSFSPAMRPKVKLQHLYLRAMLLLPETIDGRKPIGIPEACPWTLDDLIGIANHG